MTNHVPFRIFLSSPGDVHPERDRAQAVVDRLNAERPAHPTFSLTRWEQSYYLATGAFQDQIPTPGDHDIVVFIFWKRLGTDLPPAFNRADGTSRTGTEYEFEQARDAREMNGDRRPDILVYRKTAKITFNEETVDIERAQKKALDQFWERWFRSDTGHFIAGFQSAADPKDFEQQFERNLRQWLHDHDAGQVVWSIERQGSPYRGLLPFDEDHAGLFFGRDLDVSRARAAFIEAAIGRESGRRGTPFLLILGPSGAGKSSFMRAGIVTRMRVAGVPAFMEDGSDGINAFRTLVVTPREMGESLCRGLANGLYRSQGISGRDLEGLPELADGDYRDAEAFAALATGSPDSAAAPILSALKRAATGGAAQQVSAEATVCLGLLLAVDQAEELFLRSEADRGAFVRLLSALAATGRVWVTATMRNDFYDRLRQDADLSALSRRGAIYDLAPPGLADYRDIIRQPAHAAGLTFEITERRDLAAEIEAEAGGEGALPMVAFLLEQLFQERHKGLLTIETYDRLGGAAGALAQRGDQVFAKLAAPVQDAFPRVVRRLVRKSLQDLVATATSTPLAAFVPGSAERKLIEALSDARLIQSFTVIGNEGHAPTAWVRWSHEALLIRWPRLRNSVDADRRDYETLDRLQSTYSLWRSTPAPQQYERLPTDLALAEATDLVRRWGTDVDEPLRHFVEEASARAHARRRRKRRVVTVTVSALSLLSIVATIAGIMAVSQRNLAIMEQVSADRTVRFMVSLFSLADPGENRGNAVTVREVLDRGAAEVNQSLAHEPGVRADLLTAMGQAYSGLGLYGPATKLLTDALGDQKDANVPAESRVRTLVASGTTLFLAADYESAEKLLREAVDIARRRLPESNVLRSEALDALADALGQLEKYPEAEQLCREALAIDRKRGPEQAATLAHSLDTLGSLLYSDGDVAQAEPVMREALALHLRTSGRRHASTGIAMSNLAVMLFQAGRYEEAEAMYKDALPIFRDVYGADHPEYATTLNSLGRNTLMMGRVAEAEPLLRQSIALYEKSAGPTHDFLVPPLNSVAMIDGYTGQMQRARAEIQRAEQIARLPSHGEILDQVLLNSADLWLQSGELQQAAAPLAESRRLLEEKFPLAKHPDNAWRYAVWDTVDAEQLALLGDAAGAQAKLTAALPVIVNRFGPDGFHSQLARRRAQTIERSARRSHGV